jgi:ubiquinol-cytochrome c reductase cytochrome c1 subunit
MCCGNCKASANPFLKRFQEHGHDVQVFKGGSNLTPWDHVPCQYDQAVGDLVGYLQWMAEPAQNTRTCWDWV